VFTQAVQTFVAVQVWQFEITLEQRGQEPAFRIYVLLTQERQKVFEEQVTQFGRKTEHKGQELPLTA
jgi:hypothetical protein